MSAQVPFPQRVSMLCRRFAHSWTIERSEFVEVAIRLGLEPDSDPLVEELVMRDWDYANDVYFPPDPELAGWPS